MAGKGRQSWEKRQREKAKRDKQIAKRADREERKNAPTDEEPSDGPSEQELYAQFAKLSEKHASGAIDDETFEDKRAELFEKLGLEIH